MEPQPALPNPPSALSRRLSVVAAREHGVGPEQLRLIGIDADLFELFYREHVEAVQHFVVRRVGDRERAADLTTEIFLAAVDSAHNYRPRRGEPRSWLFGIARALVANEGRQRTRQRAGEARLRGSALLDEDDAARLDARIDAAARSRQLYQAMNRLPKSERTILELVALDELSLKEAAAASGMHPATARVRLHRARRKLRTELEAAATPQTSTKEKR
ncbi:MAG TPA: sigma-70 family RNA polymerase sigma factor [Solirubrobacterales bacterium]|nr:sigma-70 family RNA polymerase sigma factor [Solirubrobacterales bacterium]